MFFDPLSIMLAIPGLILALLASAFTSSTFRKYAQVGASSGLTGAEAARQMLDSQGLFDVDIRESHGFLSDHYNPQNNTLNLSPNVFHASSLAAIGVACHEAGHALQQAKHYSPMALRTFLLMPAQIGSNFSYILLIIGMAMRAPFLVNAAIMLFAAAVLFTVVTLPVEWDASRRAKLLMTQAGIVTAEELPQASAVLNAAFMTYVAGAVTAIMQLLYFLIRAGVLGGRREN